jgi:hypothetical protein
MSITAIARQAQESAQEKSSPSSQRTPTSGELIKESLKYPLSGIASMTTKPQAAAQWTTGATVLERSYRLTPTVLGQRPADPLKVATALAPQAVITRSSLIATLAAEAATAGASTTELAGGPVAEAVAVAEATRIATSPEPHMAASMPARKLRNCDGRSPPRRETTTASPPSLLGFATYSSQINSNIWDHQVRHEARPHTMAQMLRPLHRERWWQ